MIIQCGKNRRLVSDRWCWRIEARRVITEGKNKGKVCWYEDRPAFPATLSQAFEMVFERELRDQGDIACHDVPDACKRAYEAVRKYAQMAREVV